MKRSRLTKEENDARIRGYGVRLLPVENVNDVIEEETVDNKKLEGEFAGNFADAGYDDCILDRLFTEGCDYNGTDVTMEMLPKDNVFSVYQEWNNDEGRKKRMNAIQRVVNMLAPYRMSRSAVKTICDVAAVIIENNLTERDIYAFQEKLIEDYCQPISTTFCTSCLGEIPSVRISCSNQQCSNYQCKPVKGTITEPIRLVTFSIHNQLARILSKQIGEIVKTHEYHHHIQNFTTAYTIRRGQIFRHGRASCIIFGSQGKLVLICGLPNWASTQGCALCTIIGSKSGRQAVSFFSDIQYPSRTANDVMNMMRASGKLNILSILASPSNQPFDELHYLSEGDATSLTNFATEQIFDDINDNRNTELAGNMVFMETCEDDYLHRSGVYQANDSHYEDERNLSRKQDKSANSLTSYNDTVKIRGGERLSAAEYDYYKGIDLELAILNNIRSCFIRKELDIGKAGLVLLKYQEMGLIGRDAIHLCVNSISKVDYEPLWCVSELGTLSARVFQLGSLFHIRVETARNGIKEKKKVFEPAFVPKFQFVTMKFNGKPPFKNETIIDLRDITMEKSSIQRQIDFMCLSFGFPKNLRYPSYSYEDLRAENLNLAAKIGRTEEEGRQNFGKLIEDVNDFVRLVKDKLQRLL
ncbi:unnamed protein product [Caenorhabditis bovis]|uniref:Uncharacterized protein n=1 Tax=Caenorhabditis bovis TaxID=2654633 RepID=A0A8S1F0N3_9PELO|nr:unnamed protein product [Caenorhabditis bovis]